MTTPRKEADPAVARRRAEVLGMVEDRMRALVAAGIRPTVPALKAGLGPIGVGAIRRARAALVAARTVGEPQGLAPAADVAVVVPPEIDAVPAEAKGPAEVDAPRPRPRRVGPFRRDVREALRRERAFAAWSRSRSRARAGAEAEGGAS